MTYPERIFTRNVFDAFILNYPLKIPTHILTTSDVLSYVFMEPETPPLIGSRLCLITSSRQGSQEVSDTRLSSTTSR